MDRADHELINQIMERAGAPRAIRLQGEGAAELASHLELNLERVLLEIFPRINYDVMSLLGRVLREHQATTPEAHAQAMRATYRAIISAHLAPPDERDRAMETARLEIGAMFLPTAGQLRLELLPA
jgi:hypothetical protein